MKDDHIGGEHHTQSWVTGAVNMLPNCDPPSLGSLLRPARLCSLLNLSSCHYISRCTSYVLIAYILAVYVYM
jgi:hypothetical protein